LTTGANIRRKARCIKVAIKSTDPYRFTFREELDGTLMMTEGNHYARLEAAALQPKSSFGGFEMSDGSSEF
jgi:hypothetical protein